MYIAIDLILAVVILSVIFGSWRRGFIRSLFQLGSTLAAVVLAVVFYKELGTYFYDSFVLAGIQPRIGELLNGLTQELTAGLDASAIVDALPEQIGNTAEAIGLNIEELLNSYLQNENLFSTEALCESLSASIAATVAHILAFAAIFFGALIALKLVGFVLDKVCKLPILNSANKFLGFLLGLAEALLLGMAIAKLSVLVCNIYGSLYADAACLHVEENTYIAKFLLEICPW